MKTVTVSPRRARPRATPLAGAALLLLALTACDQMDPLTRPYSWNPENVNARNIAAMAARPADLIQGRGASGRYFVRGDSKAVERVWFGKHMPLLSRDTDQDGAGGGVPGSGS